MSLKLKEKSVTLLCCGETFILLTWLQFTLPLREKSQYKSICLTNHLYQKQFYCDGNSLVQDDPHPQHIQVHRIVWGWKLCKSCSMAFDQISAQLNPIVDCLPTETLYFSFVHLSFCICFRLESFSTNVSTCRSSSAHGVPHCVLWQACWTTSQHKWQLLLHSELSITVLHFFTWCVVETQ